MLPDDLKTDPSNEQEPSKLLSYNDFLRRFYPSSEQNDAAKAAQEEDSRSVFLMHVEHQ